MESEYQRDSQPTEQTARVWREEGGMEEGRVCVSNAEINFTMIVSLGEL